jgi:hypothetical protein
MMPKKKPEGKGSGGKETEDAIQVIRSLSANERRRLGGYLALEPKLLPGWRIITSGLWRDLDFAGLNGLQSALYHFCRDRWQKETDVIRYLWSADANASPDLRRDTRLRARLRRLQLRTNETLSLFKQDCQIERPKEGGKPRVITRQDRLWASLYGWERVWEMKDKEEKKSL